MRYVFFGEALKIINYLLPQFGGHHQVILVSWRVTDRTFNSRDLPNDIYE